MKEHAGPGQADQEAGDEIGDGSDVAVDPFDHLARSGLVVKTHVEGQQVPPSSSRSRLVARQPMSAPR